MLFCDRAECLIEILDDIVHIFRTDRQTDRVRTDALIGQFFFGALAVGRGRRMDDQGLHVCDVCQQGEQFQIVDELLCGLRITLDLKGKDRAAAVREVFLIQFLLRRIRGYGRMMYLLYLRMLVQVLYDLQRILHMALHAQRECLKSLQEEECMERRKGRTHVS